ncbi:MAG: citramalate synthase, partial [Propionibacteriaceae bacterium]|nr:citramalate synthase [Propionibacteriaceae bacterium]
MFPDEPENFCLYDTTLRDGAQQEGIQLTVADKLRIVELLDGLGIPFIEGGWPGANTKDTQFFNAAKQLKLRQSKMVAFGATRKAGSSAANDPLLKALVDAGTDWVCLVAKSHPGHVTQALKTSLDENLAMVHDSVSWLVKQGKQVIIDAEHYFEGFIGDASYARNVAKTAAEAGASWVVLCDTNGGMLPTQIADIISRTLTIGASLGIHCHNDTGCALANSLAAVDAGVLMVQGTMNGYGERTGNLDLVPLIGDLDLKYGWNLLTDEQLASLTHVSNAIADIVGQPRQPRQPYVGASAFAHKAGLHASALKVDENLYQHIEPASVGNRMRMLISEASGRANVEIKARELKLDLSAPGQVEHVVEAVKSRESMGYSYEAADASFELLTRDVAGTLVKPFEVAKWRVVTLGDEGENNSEATVTLVMDGERLARVGEGNGPVDALGDGLRQGLMGTFPSVKTYELVDYRVRILD